MENFIPVTGRDEIVYEIAIVIFFAVVLEILLLVLYSDSVSKNLFN